MQNKIKVMKIFSRKKHAKSLKELFVECSELTKKAFETMKKSVLAYVDGNFSDTQKFAKETISLEKQQDRVKEEFFQRLFSRETMVFSRTDRIQIIENIDKITDKIEIVVRKLLLYQVEIHKNLREGIKEIVDLNEQIGVQVHDMVVNIQDNFQEVRENIISITNLRRSVREKQWELQKLNYDHQQDFQAFRYTETLIKNLMEAADRAEIFADRVFILVNKYAL